MNSKIFHSFILALIFAYPIALAQSSWTVVVGLGQTAEVDSLYASGTDVFVGGTFSTFSNLAKWVFSCLNQFCIFLHFNWNETFFWKWKLMLWFPFFLSTDMTPFSEAIQWSQTEPHKLYVHCAFTMATCMSEDPESEQEFGLTELIWLQTNGKEFQQQDQLEVNEGRTEKKECVFFFIYAIIYFL